MSHLTDFDLDNLIGALSKLKQSEAKLLRYNAIVEWLRRYPDNLPPCYEGMEIPDDYDGPREIYTWPKA
jgi:hypothetical protein